MWRGVANSEAAVRLCPREEEPRHLAWLFLEKSRTPSPLEPDLQSSHSNLRKRGGGPVPRRATELFWKKRGEGSPTRGIGTRVSSDNFGNSLSSPEHSALSSLPHSSRNANGYCHV